MIFKIEQSRQIPGLYVVKSSDINLSGYFREEDLKDLSNTLLEFLNKRDKDRKLKNQAARILELKSTVQMLLDPSKGTLSEKEREEVAQRVLDKESQ